MDTFFSFIYSESLCYLKSNNLLEYIMPTDNILLVSNDI